MYLQDLIEEVLNLWKLEPIRNFDYKRLFAKYSKSDLELAEEQCEVNNYN